MDNNAVSVRHHNPARRRIGTTTGVLIVACCLMPLPVRGGDEEVDLPRQELIFAQHSDATRRDYDIWRICADGTQMASLVVMPEHQIQFTISPDGNELIFASNVDGNMELMRRKFNGGEAVNITNHVADDSGPRWSPDGKTLAFFSTRDTQKPDLYLMDPESESVRRLTDNTFYDSGGSWHPDGRSFIFTRFIPGDAEKEHDGAGEVIRIDCATGEETQLTELGGYNGGLCYSPDGTRIAFHHTSDTGVELWVMNADGSAAHAMTDTFVDEYSPAWSPDGNWIAFTAGTQHDGRGTFDLFIMRPDGTDRRLITRAANTQMEPQWRRGDHRCR